MSEREERPVDMYCGNCGAAVDPRDAFCRACGARFADAPTGGGAQAAPTQVVPVTPASPPPGSSRRGKPVLISVAFAAIVVGCVVAFLVLRNRNSSAELRPDPSSTSNLDAALPPIVTLDPGATTTTAASTTTAPATVGTTVEQTTSTPPATTGPPNSVTTPIAPSTVPNTAGTVPPATATIAPTSTAAGQPAGPIVVSVSASAVRADDVDSCGASTSYAASMAADGRLDTAWMVGGDGVGAYLELSIRPGSTITAVGLVPGYAKQDQCSGANRFLQMRRITRVRWTFDGGNEVSQTLDPASPKLQPLQLPAAVQPRTVRMTIISTTQPGTPPLDYAPISEITLS